VIEAETCRHLVTLNKINIHNTSCVLTCESLLLVCVHRTQRRWITYRCGKEILSEYIGRIRLAQDTGDLTAGLQTVINLLAASSSKTLCTIFYRGGNRFSLTARDVARCEFQIAFCKEGGRGVGGLLGSFNCVVTVSTFQTVEIVSRCCVPSNDVTN